MSATATTDLSPAPNLRRAWIPNKVQPVYETAGDFVVMTYNILNKDFCPEGVYPTHCPDEMLTVDRRHPLLMKEIDHHSDADIICMQEVNCQYYEDFLLPDMQKRGFSGTYIRRPQPTGKATPFHDGSATFFRECRFQMDKKVAGHFKELFKKELGERFAVREGGAPSSSPPSMADSSRAYLFTLLRCSKTQRLVAIGNVHLTFDEFNKMNLIALEAAFSVNEFDRFCGSDDVPRILCGDFNQEPHHPGYQLIHNGSLNHTMETYLRRCNQSRQGDQKVTPLVDMYPDSFKHKSTSLKSAYETIVGHEVPFSNYEDSSLYIKKPKITECSEAVKDLMAGTPSHPEVRKSDPEACGSEKYVAALDYLWFSSDTLHCDGVLKMVDEEQILPFHACPNAVFPSDHLPIKAKFSFFKN